VFRIRTTVSSGFSLLEIILAVAIFATFSTGIIGVVIQGLQLNRLSAEETIASQYASAGLEAVRSIKNQSYSLLADTAGTGLTNSTGVWAFSGANNLFDKYTRTVSISTVQRDTDGNIVQSGGTSDPSTKKATATVNWTVSGSRHNSISQSTYLTNWSAAIVSPSTSKQGFLVYSTGGTASDSYVYRTYDPAGGVWNAPVSMPDIDPNTSNRAVRMVKVYSSTKAGMVVSGAGDSSYNGTYIEAGIYNGRLYYQKDDSSNHYIEWTNTGGDAYAWMMNTGLSTPMITPVYFAGGNDLPGNPWSNADGILPAPTVSIGSSASAKKQKMILSRHSDGTNQYIYAQVYDTNTASFIGTPNLLSTITNNSNLFQQNFDGTYLGNGDFMAIFTENSNTPKMRIWNGSVWGDSVSLRSIGGIPNWIVTKTRPGTNEVMAAFFTQNKDTNSEYFNGGAYDTSSWTIHSQHSASAPANYYHLVDFTWDSDDPTKGTLIYPESATDRSVTAKIWTADGAGSGSWSSAGNSANQDTGRYVADMRVVSRPGTNQFLTCDEDNNPSSRIYCFNFDSIPIFNTPANNVIASLSDSGPQRAYDIAFPTLSGSTGLSVYSDRTNIAKLKKFDAVSNSWDSAATVVGTLSGLLKIVSMHSDPLSNDIMILLADANQNLYTGVWDGATNQLYTTPSWKSFANQAAHGSANAEQWFDFAWDTN